MLVLKNELSTVLCVDSLVFQVNGAAGDEKTVLRKSASIAAAVEAGQLSIVSETPEAGDSFILGEVVSTGVEQSIEHGLDTIPSEVAAAVTYVPDTGYGGGSGKPFAINFGEHTETHIKVTATSGIKFKLIVSP